MCCAKLSACPPPPSSVLSDYPVFQDASLLLLWCDIYQTVFIYLPYATLQLFVHNPAFDTFRAEKKRSVMSRSRAT